MAGECCNVNVVKDCCGNAIEPGVGVDREFMASLIWRLALALVLASQSMMFGLGINITPPQMGSRAYVLVHGGLILSSVIVMILLGRPLVKDVIKNIKDKRLSLEGLFFISAIGALVGSLIATITGKGQVYYEVVAIVLVIYTIGKILSVRSRQKAIDESNKVREDFNYAYVINAQGRKERVSLDKVHCCCEVVVGPGDAITVDGIIMAGEGFVNETAMTGELEPAIKRAGNYILAGCYSVDAVFTIKPTGTKGARRLDGLLKTVEEARLSPSVLQEQADKIVRWFLPFVVTVSVGTFLFWLGRVAWVNALFNSMAVLLVACPCALGLATPIAIWSGLWKLSRLGLISRSGELIDSLARADLIIFDKTGTLSEEDLKLVDFVMTSNMKENEEWLKEVIYVIESQIDHPIAKALAKISEGSKERFVLLSSRIIPGKGIEAQLKEVKKGSLITVHLGELELMSDSRNEIWEELRKSNSLEKRVYISINNEPAAIVVLDERMRSGIKETFKALKELNIGGKILTGDRSGRYEVIEGVEVISGLSPMEKEIYVKEFEKGGNRTIFVGDGVNDAAAMAISSGSIAMGCGASLTQATASAILMGDSLEVLPKAVKLCRKIRRSVRGNLIYAAIYNCFGMGFAATGILHPVMAAILMLVSSVGVSIRATKVAREI